MTFVTDFAVPAAVVFLMLVVGLGLTPADFRRVTQRPGITLVGTVGPLVCLPLVAGVVILALRPVETVVAGLILVAAAPGASLSNMLVYLGRGSTALSVTLTALSNTIGILSFPLLAAAGFSVFLGVRTDAAIPVSLMVRQLVLVMLLPIIAGMVIRHLRPALAERHSNLLKRVSLVFVGAIVAFIILSQRALFAQHALAAVGIASLVVLGGMACGLGLSWIMRTSAEDRLAYVVEFGLRNAAVAIVVAGTTLGRLDYAVFIVAYFVVEMVIMLGVLGVMRMVTTS